MCQNVGLMREYESYGAAADIRCGTVYIDKCAIKCYYNAMFLKKNGHEETQEEFIPH
jgi:hypothetical protein